MNNNNCIIYEVLQEKDLENTIACLAEVFPNSEPLAEAVKITRDEFYPLANYFCKIAVQEGLSHIAKNSLTGEVVGFIVAEDLKTETLSGNQLEINFLLKNCVKINPIVSLLTQLEQQYRSINLIKNFQILHWVALGVKKNYRNQNIGQTLVKNNQKLAQEKGFKKIICEATGLISQNIAFKQEFQEIISIDYQHYEYQGVKVFSCIAPHSKCILMEKTL